VRYGGNTTCIEIRTDDNELLILDAGTGIFPLSQTLLAEMPLTANVLLSHTHWDHIQGLPFFVPNFIPGNTLRLHGAFDPISGSGVEQAMSVQLQYSYFPVREAELKGVVGLPADRQRLSQVQGALFHPRERLRLTAPERLRASGGRRRTAAPPHPRRTRWAARS
jgi:phosphoribosyl 1,2-cyclic phosphodiesterase